ncbi:hypothetical protein [Schaalia canis]|uniref:Uncharacterized protein n=1 Tax=Schaalia canis TaxID=100469 RepID=A0A3P1SDL5_9ACTO|nr:hypothetical protein [Schaalia canis]RRC94835.1 hypothetical protein EII11_08110 [Schaalia canis]
MFKKFGAALATCALAATLGVVAIPGALASSEPAVPVVKLTAATCADKSTHLSVTGFEADSNAQQQYRFVVEVEGLAKPLKQLNGAERKSVLTGETNAATIFGESKLEAMYGKTVTIKSYWFNTGKNGTFKFPVDRQVANFTTMAGDNMTKMVPLGASNTLTLVDPATLNCTPAGPAPKDSADDITVPTSHCCSV